MTFEVGDRVRVLGGTYDGEIGVIKQIYSSELQIRLDSGGVWSSYVDGVEKVHPCENGGKKNDSGKPRWGLLPYDALREVVIVYTEGAKIYEDRNWEKGLAWSRVYESTMRHLTDWWQYRQTEHPDHPGLRQLAQAAWGCLVLLAYELREVGKDDRP